MGGSRSAGVLRKRKKKIKNLWPALSLILILFTSYLCFFARINQMMTDSCFKKLQQTAEQLIWELENQVSADGEILDSMVRFVEIYGVNDVESCKKVLSAYQEDALLAELMILYPDNTILLRDGSKINAPLELSFEKLASRGTFITNIEKHVLDPDREVMYRVVPILSEGKTIAELIGVVDLERLRDSYIVNVYTGNAYLFLIEGISGDYILDTWHKEPGTMEDFKERKPIGDYNIQELEDQIKGGESGTLIFYSEKARENFYGYYAPVSINNWRLLLTVPERIAFADRHDIRQLFFIIVCFEVLLFGIYLCFSIRNIRKDMAEKEKQLGQVQYMYDVEKLLFDAHRSHNKITQALERISQAVEADTTFFIVLKEKTVVRNYSWNKAEKQFLFLQPKDELSLMLPWAYPVMCRGESIVWKNSNHYKEKYPQEFFVFQGFHNIMMSPVLDMNGSLAGILGAADIQFPCEDARMLECVGLSFSMAMNNYITYQTIKEMGMLDYNTGLLNRNSYHNVLTQYQNTLPDTLGCIYLDVNGLHEVNNCLGHDAGDNMLREIAAIFRKRFGEKNTYRIGGDEFVAVCENLAEKDIQENMQLVQQEVLAKGYHVSIGMSWRETDIEVDEMVREAEKKMYESKRLYYQEKGDIRKARDMNRRLETMLLQKKDSEAFLSILACQFLGVYIVDLLTDKARYIYIPEYFKVMMEQFDWKFSKAHAYYAQEYVHWEDLEEYERFLDYNYIRKKLKQNKMTEMRYRRKDGKQVLLCIYRNGAFTSDNQETLWIYKNI